MKHGKKDDESEKKKKNCCYKYVSHVEKRVNEKFRANFEQFSDFITYDARKLKDYPILMDSCTDKLYDRVCMYINYGCEKPIKCLALFSFLRPVLTT